MKPLHEMLVTEGQRHPRVVRIYEDHLEMEMSSGKSVLIDHDCAYLFSVPWGLCGGYAARNIERGQAIYLHRLVLNGFSERVDHINGDKLDNRRANLRPASHRDNIRNQRLRIDSSTGFKGVRKRYKKWSAQITYDGRQIHLGSANSAEDAAILYDKAAEELFGEFSKTNRAMGLL